MNIKIHSLKRRRFVRLLVAMFIVVQLELLTAQAQTIFSGGNLSDLRDLDSSLTFDHLIIDGDLFLEGFDNMTLTVTNFTLTETGSIFFRRDSCNDYNAPDVTIQATGSVLVAGGITLDGKHGDRVSDSSSCFQCTGGSGGTVLIEADSLSVSGSISTSGNNASTFRIRVGGDVFTSGCNGGNAGAIELEATNIDLSDAFLNNEFGTGSLGDSGRAADGSPGHINIRAVNEFKMIGGAISTDGNLTIEAVATEILAPLTYASISTTVDGKIDTGTPSVQILYPFANSQIRLDVPLRIIAEVIDNNGTGFKSISVIGLGVDPAISPVIFADGRIMTTIQLPLPPGDLEIVVTDNKENMATDTVNGISFHGPFVIDAGETA